MDAPPDPTPALPASPDGRPELAAAVDLGSNSFHLLVARVEGDRLVVIDRLKERVRLAAGLGPDGRLSQESQDRALACLDRFGQRLRDMPPGSVRAVGTNTLRRAKNRPAFLEQAHAALGHPIEVVSGREEARLVYLGVAHSVADPVPGARRLVVDIGGGSTEIIIGENLQPLAAESMYMGCVGYSLRFFPEGRLTEDAFQQAFIAARLEMEPHKKRFRAMGWERALGSSGTILAVEEVLRAQGWGSRITDKALRRLRKAMVAAGHVDKLALAGLQPERLSVFAGGVAILQGVLRSLHLETLEAATGTIREGALFDQLGRRHQQDARDATVLDLVARWSIDALQASRVERTARVLLARVAAPWDLRDPELAKALSWAARLHELGLTIGHSGYHRHGAYVLAQADMPGFSRQDQEVLGILVRSHRRKLRVEDFAGLPLALRRRVLRLAVLLRVAVRLHRSRSDRPLPPLVVRASRDKLAATLFLGFEPGWLAEHPLTTADLDRERAYQELVKHHLVVADAELPVRR